MLPSRNAFSLRLRDGWRSLRSAFASIWRMRSRVTASAVGREAPLLAWRGGSLAPSHSKSHAVHGDEGNAKVPWTQLLRNSFGERPILSTFSLEVDPGFRRDDGVGFLSNVSDGVRAETRNDAWVQSAWVADGCRRSGSSDG